MTIVQLAAFAAAQVEAQLRKAGFSAGAPGAGSLSLASLSLCNCICYRD